MAGANTIQFTDSNFDAEVMKSTQPVLVDFWAEWCQPCRMLGPTIDAIATDFAGKAKVGKLDTDGNQQVAVKFGITAIPTVIIFKNGQQVKRFTGIARKEDIAAAINAAM